MITPTPTPPLRGGESRGQALIETAVTLPVLLLLMLAFLAGGVGAQGYVDLNTAVYLAAASNVTAFADDQPDADQYARDTFNATVAHDTLLETRNFQCGGNYAAGGTITCQATATIRFSRTPLSVITIRDPDLSASADATRSLYRSVKP